MIGPKRLIVQCLAVCARKRAAGEVIFWLLRSLVGGFVRTSVVCGKNLLLLRSSILFHNNDSSHRRTFVNDRNSLTI